MRIWLIASICTLLVSWLGALCSDSAEWDTFHYFTATCLFGIFLKIKE